MSPKVFRAWDGSKMTDWDDVWLKPLAYWLTGKKPEVLMQFTGFTDREGQEVYEGDILTDPTFHPDEQQWWPLYYDHGSYVVNDSVIWDYARFVKKPGVKHGQPIYELEDLVVEGNIYENKDMLDDWQVQNLKEFGYELGS